MPKRALQEARRTSRGALDNNQSQAKSTGEKAVGRSELAAGKLASAGAEGQANAPISIGKFGSRAKAKRKRAASTMSPDLEKVASQVSACLRSEAASIVTQQFLAGRHVAAVQEDSKYGEEGVRKLATKLKLPWKFLLRLSARARAFSADAVTAAVATAAANNYVLSTSIFDELVSVDNADDRQCFLEDAIARKWTVRELRAKVRPGPKPSAQVKCLPLPRVIGCAEALMDALAAVPLNAVGAGQPEDRERALATLVKLALAVNDATQRLVSEAGAQGGPSEAL